MIRQTDPASEHWADHAGGIRKSGKNEDAYQYREIDLRLECGERHRPLGCAEYAHVFVGAGVDAVEAERAIHVAAFARLKQPAVRSRGWSRLPRMHSFVVQRPQISGSRTLTASGEHSDSTKLNWPIGQTYLQKVPGRNRESMSKAATK